ncbi:tRNA-splicing endonuclease subunit [Basidiobolus ranarum]|uniref:tRNA-splicing endonuclease subunit Sen34 n=1 Tax=Basidiobolus ranarum TaxID=34480 RepID=A0ABR2WGM9_9FUNG
MNKIAVYIAQGHGFLRDATAACTLRSEYRIVGVLVGSLPRLPLQNSFFSLPILLMPEEVTFLLEKGLVSLIDDKDSYREPTEAEIEEYQGNLSREEHFRQQLFEEKKRNNPKAQANSIDVDLKVNGKSEEEIPSIPTQELRKTRKAVKVPTSSSQYAWHDPKKVYDTIEEARANGVWEFPSTAAEKLRYKVFVDLREKGYFITPGSKFGGDYLLYPADPLRYHSHFVASIVPYDKELMPVDLVGFGRLGSAVKKSHLLCSYDLVHDSFKYFCVEWTGM